MAYGNVVRNAGAAVPDQQMRPRSPRYPVDRYLVESSNKVEMINIMDDDLWHSEPALKPEDEIILRKLHDMLQSTANDLKLLSGELSKYREPRVQVKTQPMPLDKEFNEKVHIEEIVNAKFHGHLIVEKPQSIPPVYQILNGATTTLPKSTFGGVPPPISESCANEIKRKPVTKRNLSVTRPKVIAIEANIENSTKNKKQCISNVRKKPTIVYNKFTYQNVEPEFQPQNKLIIQDMPKIDIRSELKEQKVLQLDIIPDNNEIKQIASSRNNVAVISIDHDKVSKDESNIQAPSIRNPIINHSQPSYVTKQPARKITKMSTCDSSGSTTNNISSDTLHNIKTQKHLKSVIKSSPKNSSRDRFKSKKTSVGIKKENHSNIEEWKKKLNAVYGKPSSSKNTRTAYKSKVKNEIPKKSNLPQRKSVLSRNILNNSEYTPYSQLTLGGVRVSDIEKEISDIPNKNDLTLGPLLDKILSSQENTPRRDDPNDINNKEKIFTTSDENLLEEVLNIERKVTKTIARSEVEDNQNLQNTSNGNQESDEQNSYADDFEEDRSDNAHSTDSKASSVRSKSEDKQSINSNEENLNASDGDVMDSIDNSPSNKRKSKIHDRTYTKVQNLAFKNSVDVFEFVHAVDTHEIATQSNTTQKISLKETQTSPRNEKQSVTPIHNDLWPVDPKREVEKMFELEKDFIKKLILDEYGDILEKTVTKPSTSRDDADRNTEKNVNASQKNTQTSPAHVKSVMTSPTKTKTRTTSPFLSVKIDHQTSPMVIVTNEQELTVELDNDEEGISVNLSSPRFSLRLPQTSREILSNLDDCNVPAKFNKSAKSKTSMKCQSVSSSSSVDEDNSSDLSSLGEVKLKLKTKHKRIATISESSSTSTLSKYSSDFNSAGILPLRSEGELSAGQVDKKAQNKPSRSEGETSFGRSK